jgi:hypothetical protein
MRPSLTGWVVYAALSDGLGAAGLLLILTHLDTLETVYEQSARANFTDPLRVLRCLFQVDEFSFPEPGRYVVSLLVEEEVAAECVLTVQRRTGDG